MNSSEGIWGHVYASRKTGHQKCIKEDPAEIIPKARNSDVVSLLDKKLMLHGRAKYLMISSRE